MPASSLDPVSAALCYAFASGHEAEAAHSLDGQLAGAGLVQRVLTPLEYESNGISYTSNLAKVRTQLCMLQPPAKKHKDANGTTSTTSISSISSNSSTSYSNGNCTSFTCSSSNKQEVKSAEKKPAKDNLTPPKRVLFPLENIQLGWKKMNWSAGAGMFNLGNSCYMNATLQALFHVPALVNWLLSDENHMKQCKIAGSEQDGCIICAMLETLLQSQKNAMSFRPMAIYSKLRLICRHMVPHRQEDAHEFMRYLIEAMEKAYLARFRDLNLDIRSKETTPLNQIFGGYLRSTVQCARCSGISTTFEHFQDLILDICSANTLHDALQSYFSREKLDDQNYNCDDCRREVQATKQYSLERAPMVLCIQLKRFTAQAKISRQIEFGKNLDLTRFMHKRLSAPLVYRLVALVIHVGGSANGGHYTAVAQAPTGKFYNFDDGLVSEVSPHAVTNPNAYIMMYELESAPNPPRNLTNASVKSSFVSSEKTAPAAATACPPSTSPASSSSCSCSSSSASPPPATPSAARSKNSPSHSHSPSPSPKLSNGSATPSKNGSATPAKNGNKHSSDSDSDGHQDKENDEKRRQEGSVAKLVPYDVDESSSGTEEVAGSERRVATKASNGAWIVTSRKQCSNNQNNNQNNHHQSNGWTEKPVTDGDVIFDLVKASHYGYSAPVSNWNGNRSQMDREVHNERREERKRAYADSYDEGRKKHMKLDHGAVHKPPPSGYNAFQAYQNNRRFNGSQYNRNYCGGNMRNRNFRRHNNNNYHRRLKFKY